MPRIHSAWGSFRELKIRCGGGRVPEIPAELEVAGEELAETKRVIAEALAVRPHVNEVAFALAAR
jgi:hypothetical protein